MPLCIYLALYTKTLLTHSQAHLRRRLHLAVIQLALHLFQDGERFSNRLFPVIRHADSGINFRNQHEGKSFGQGNILARRKAGTVGESPTRYIWQLCPPSRVQLSTNLSDIQSLEENNNQRATPLEEHNNWAQKPSREQAISFETQTTQGSCPTECK